MKTYLTVRVKWNMFQYFVCIIKNVYDYFYDYNIYFNIEIHIAVMCDYDILSDNTVYYSYQLLYIYMTYNDNFYNLYFYDYYYCSWHPTIHYLLPPPPPCLLGTTFFCLKFTPKRKFHFLHFYICNMLHVYQYIYNQKRTT